MHFFSQRFEIAGSSHFHFPLNADRPTDIESFVIHITQCINVVNYKNV